MKKKHPLTPTRRSLPISLLRTRELIMRDIRPVLHEHDITEQQWRVLRVICESEHATDAGSIADRACILAPSLTRIIRTLSKSDLIKVNRDLKDGRKIMLEGTDKGHHFLEEVSSKSTEVFAKLRRVVGDDRWEDLINLLAEFRDDINQSQADSETPPTSSLSN